MTKTKYTAALQEMYVRHQKEVADLVRRQLAEKHELDWDFTQSNKPFRIGQIVGDARITNIKIFHNERGYPYQECEAVKEDGSIIILNQVIE